MVKQDLSPSKTAIFLDLDVDKSKDGRIAREVVTKI
ncbi:hypothetical protein NIES4106_38790 [Fischerella sp. NIES-4106]|jgi:hypothetical protein|nr:hypothetical protein NIES4106_38790 [Fischerella sp. NIES-4106]